MIQTNFEIPEECVSRIYELLDLSTLKPLTGIFSEVGFNKTGIVKNWLKDRGHSHLWIDAGQYSTDGSRLSGKISRQIALFSPEDPSEPLYIAIGGYSNIAASSALHSELISLAENNPENLHLIIIGRSMPPLPLTRLKAHDLYSQIDSGVLAYTKEETSAYFGQSCGRKLDEYEEEALYDTTSGWPAVCRLMADYLNSHADANILEISSHAISRIPDIADYLEEEVFAKEPQKIQQFLMKTSLLAELDPEIIRAFDEADANDTLNYLERNRYYIYTDSHNQVKYLNIFRSFLYHRFCMSAQSKVTELHCRLADIYTHKHAFASAFCHAVAGSDYFMAQDIFQRLGDRYDPIQFVDIIDGHLEFLASDLHFSHTSLFLTRCIPEETLIEFIPFLKELIKYEKSKSNTFRLANLQNRLGCIFFHLGYVELAEEQLLASCSYSEKLEDAALLVCNMQLLADCCLIREELDKSAEIARKALFIADNNDLNMMLIHTLEVLHRIYLKKGELKKSRRYLEEAEDLAEDGPFLSLWLLQDMSLLLLQEGKREEAEAAALRACGCVGDNSPGYDRSSTSLALGKVLLGSEKYAEAAKQLDNACRNAQNCGMVLYDILLSQLKLLTAQELTDEASSKRTEISALCRKYNYTWSPFYDTGSAIQAVSEEALGESGEQKRTLEVRTMGTFEILNKGKPVKINRSSSISLFQFLLVNRGKGINKEVILDHVFPQDTDTNHFNVALSTLRKNLEPGLSSGKDSRYIIREKQTYLINMEEFRIDADELLSVCQRITDQNAEIDPKLFNRFNELYRGEFMVDYPYEEFLEQERESINRKCIDTMICIADYYRSSPTPARGIEYYERILAAEPYYESIYLDYMDLLLSLRTTHKARDVADKMIRYIEEELDSPVRDSIRSVFAKHGFTYKRSRSS